MPEKENKMHLLAHSHWTAFDAEQIVLDFTLGQKALYCRTFLQQR